MTAPNEITVMIQRLPHALDGELPEYETVESAGLDLPAANDQSLTLARGQRARIPTGLAIALPPGYEAQVRPRSGLALKHGVTVLNSPGTIDADYRGEIGVILVNLGEDPVIIKRGMRIAQLVIAPITRVAWNERAELPDTKRSTRGFGSTGTSQTARGLPENNADKPSVAI